jgi:hypothetical protein
VTGLTPGTEYVLSFLEFGDNISTATSSDPYRLEVDLSSSVGIELSSERSWTVHGPGVAQTLYFTPATTDVLVRFVEDSPGGASPIIDDISISAVPEVGTGMLLLAGILGLTAGRRVRDRG